ncbi:MAG: hypothetical protein RQ826_17770, partial [Xanthomonadales bacterium]|nr:hypothetical protein [Xanthomonadales bacterium]
TTGYAGEGEGAPYREPNPYGKWVYALSNADLLERDADREVLTALARRKLEDPDAGVDDLLHQLGPSGRAVHEFIANTNPQHVRALIEALPDAVRGDIKALDLAARDLSALEADVILIHGRGDDIIPYTESVALAGALPPGQAELYLLEGLQHVDREFSGADGWRLWQALYALLSYRL